MLHILGLPDEMFPLIFQYLCQEYWRDFAIVCKHIYAVYHANLEHMIDQADYDVFNLAKMGAIETMRIKKLLPDRDYQYTTIGRAIKSHMSHTAIHLCYNDSRKFIYAIHRLLGEDNIKLLLRIVRIYIIKFRNVRPADIKDNIDALKYFIDNCNELSFSDLWYYICTNNAVEVAKLLFDANCTHLVSAFDYPASYLNMAIVKLLIERKYTISLHQSVNVACDKFITMDVFGYIIKNVPHEYYLPCLYKAYKDRLYGIMKCFKSIGVTCLILCDKCRNEQKSQLLLLELQSRVPTADKKCQCCK